MRPLYQTQRLMRGIRKAALQRGVVAILDLGTSKIACLVLRFDGPERSRAVDGVGPMAGQAQFRVIGHGITRSRGVRFGEVPLDYLEWLVREPGMDADAVFSAKHQLANRTIRGVRADRTEMAH